MHEKDRENRIPVSELRFEQALQELGDIVKALENGNVELDIAMESYARGQQLQKRCKELLQAAKLQVEQIVEQDGKAEGVVDATNTILGATGSAS